MLFEYIRLRRIFQWSSKKCHLFSCRLNEFQWKHLHNDESNRPWWQQTECTLTVVMQYGKWFSPLLVLLIVFWMDVNSLCVSAVPNGAGAWRSDGCNGIDGAAPYEWVFRWDFIIQIANMYKINVLMLRMVLNFICFWLQARVIWMGCQRWELNTWIYVNLFYFSVIYLLL